MLLAAIFFFIFSGMGASNTTIKSDAFTSLDNFAQCLKDKGAQLFCHSWDSKCQKQKAYFGTAAIKVPYFECGIPNTILDETQICRDNNIDTSSIEKIAPTWIFANGDRTTGVVSLKQLAQKTDCELPQDISRPILISSISTAKHSNAFALSENNVLYIVSGSPYENAPTSFLQIFNVSDPSRPKLVASVSTGLDPTAVALSGNYAYVASDRLIQIFDVSIITKTHLVSSVKTKQQSHGMTDTLIVDGNHVYEIGDSDTLEIFDASNPSRLVPINSIDTDNSPSSAVISGDYIYITNHNSNTLQTFNISNPARPLLSSTTKTGREPLSNFVSGKYLYVTNAASKTLQIFDLSNPSEPILINSVATLYRPVSLYVSGNYLYTANYSVNAIQIFDITDPVKPVSVNAIDTMDNYPMQILISGGYAYLLGHATDILQVFDVSNTNHELIKI